MIEQLRIIILKKTLHPKMIHCCEATRSMLSNYFCIKQVLRSTFGEIWRIQIQIYPKTYVELKSQRASKSHYRSKSYGNFAERGDFAIVGASVVEGL